MCVCVFWMVCFSSCGYCRWNESIWSKIWKCRVFCCMNQLAGCGCGTWPLQILIHAGYIYVLFVWDISLYISTATTTGVALYVKKYGMGHFPHHINFINIVPYVVSQMKIFQFSVIINNFFPNKWMLLELKIILILCVKVNS